MRLLNVCVLIVVMVLTVGCSQIDNFRYGDEVRAAVLKNYKMTDAEYTLNAKLGVFSNPKYEWPVPVISSPEDYEIFIQKVVDPKDYIYEKIAFVDIKNIINGMKWTKKVGLDDGKWKVTLFQKDEDLNQTDQKMGMLMSMIR